MLTRLGAGFPYRVTLMRGSPEYIQQMEEKRAGIASDVRFSSVAVPAMFCSA